LSLFKPALTYVKYYRPKEFITASYDGRSTRMPSLYVNSLTANLFGHSSNFCGKPPKCLKSDQPHAKRECQKPIGTLPKCVNCGRAHPSNFTDCPSYQQFNFLHQLQPCLPKPAKPSFHFQQALKPPTSPSPPQKHGLKLQLNLQTQRILSLSAQCLKP